MLLPHLKINPKIVSKIALLPGDPARVDIIGKQLKGFEIINQNREFRIGLGIYKNVPVLVCSTGIGSPSTAIVVEELISAGIKTLIRIGTCGGAWRKDIKNGSLIIPSACVRNEGTTQEYIPAGFPAIADTDVVNALKRASVNYKNKIYVGINRTHDAFYGNQESITKWGKYLLDKKWRNYDTPILSSDMECSTIFVIASLKGVKAGAVLLVNANPEPLKDRLVGKKQLVVAKKTDSKNFLESQMKRAIKVALEAIKELNSLP